MTVSPRSRIFVPAAEMSGAKNSQPLVFRNFSRGCFTMASNGTSWRMVPTGYSTFGTLSLKIRIASASCWGSACLMRVFRTWGQSRMHPKVCSDTETSAGDATDTIQKANPTTSRLRLNMTPPFCQVVKPRFTDIKSRRLRRQPWRAGHEACETPSSLARSLGRFGDAPADALETDHRRHGAPLNDV